jgi:hypothetical protein
MAIFHADLQHLDLEASKSKNQIAKAPFSVLAISHVSLFVRSYSSTLILYLEIATHLLV